MNNLLLEPTTREVVIFPKEAILLFFFFHNNKVTDHIQNAEIEYERMKRILFEMWIVFEFIFLAYLFWPHCAPSFSNESL